jgi:arachidonate 15-lipoxygenase
MAKAVVDSADGNHHELATHLSRTHLFLEPLVVATYRQLSVNHPLYRLLVPHFKGTIFINYLAKQKLIAPGGGVDYLLSGTIESDAGVAIQSVLTMKFNESFFPETLKKRKVMDISSLEYYPYRDDGLLVWNAIENWVRSYLNTFYHSREDVLEDYELQLWAKEISSATGGRVKDFGEDGNGKLETLEYLVLTATQIIFTASAGHHLALGFVTLVGGGKVTKERFWGKRYSFLVQKSVFQTVITHKHAGFEPAPVDCFAI